MKRWLPFPESGETLSRLKISPLLARVLNNRGLSDPDSAAQFLSPKLSFLRDPFDIPNIGEAAGRVLLAKERGEKALVYGDYDVDGVTGTSILVQTLKLLGMDVSYYIPHRYGEGYGLSLESVKKIAASGVKLIITVDCGIASAVEIEAANSLGMDVIVTDHHNLPSILPGARAIVNPKQIPGEHPSKHLSGAGVAFKFAWALLRAAGVKDSVFLTSLLDLAALGTISDVVPLTGENRIIAAAGLNVLNERKRPGVRHLTEAASIYGRIAVNHIYFGLAPRLNAAGRLEHAAKAVELLLSEDPAATRELAAELSKINSRRQEIGAAIKKEVFARLNGGGAAVEKLILLTGENWHPGVIGIVASQVVDAYYRPTVLIGVNDGVGRGSARSVDGLNIYEILNSCRDLFLDFGGHAGAAGFEIGPANIPELRRRLEEYVSQAIQPDQLIPTLRIDAEIEPAQITLGLVKELEKLSPFGEANPEPLLMLRGLTLTDFRGAGADGRHLKARFSRDGYSLETIGFGLGNSYTLTAGNSYDIAFNLEANEYNGFDQAQLSIIDLREAEK